MIRFARYSFVCAAIFGYCFGNIAAQADTQVRLGFQGREFRGSSQIHLRIEANRQHPEIRLDQYRLSSIHLIAKSKRGNGEATLEVGDRYSETHTIDGSAPDYDDGSRGTYDQIEINSPNSFVENQGEWILHLKGNVKVLRVILFLDERTPDDDPSRLTIIKIGEMRADKFVGSSETFSVMRNNVTHAGIQGNKARVEVTEAWATLYNGQTVQLRQLLGVLRDGERKIEKISFYGDSRWGAFVESITLRARSLNLTGSRGEILVGIAIDPREGN